eukprot:jgi/Astpho2/5985/e_gw1.00084.8.1_t
MSRAGLSSQMAQMRASIEKDSQLGSLMAGLRGSNMNSSDFAEDGVVMQLVAVEADEAEQLPLVYNPDAIAAFWSRRPIAVARRVVQLLRLGWPLVAGLAWDLAWGRLQANEVKRAIQLRNIVTRLGPAYIKLGQALSIRPDILSTTAMNELQKLCDKVPSFDNATAMSLIAQELGQPWHELYADLSPRPIAAASLGQVYKGRLKTGEVVAVKVQRPHVLETVTIDLFVVRKIGVALRRFPEITTDTVALLDEWATRFFEELDYVKEGQNGTIFAEQMREALPQVVIPKTYELLTSRRVLTTQWIEGEKLAQSQANDVGSLCNLGVICFLRQLLDTGFFHADPHPGNLIRTPDGRLALLDFGLVTTVDDNIRYGMIEAISHLIHRDYEAIAQDFVTLQFMDKGTDLRPIMPVLAKVFDQALAGGGARAINFQQLAEDLADVTFSFPFQIPAYFALIIRAISVLEGIALVGNPNFAIVDEAYPFIAQKLLTDNSPRLKAALKYMVYGKDGVFDADRLIDLLSAFEDYSVASKSAQGKCHNGTTARAGAAPAASPQVPGGLAGARQTDGSKTAREALRFLFSPEGTFMRDFFSEELVKSIDAMSRAQLLEVARRLGLEGAGLPLLLPGAAHPYLPFAPQLSREDEQVIGNVTKLVNFLTAGNASSFASGSLDPQVARELLPFMGPIVQEMLPRLSRDLFGRMSARTLRELYVGPAV